jgi:iron complex transport system permease protein
LSQPRRALARLVLPASAALFLAALALCPLVGSTSVSLRAAFEAGFDVWESPDAAILMVARLPRVLLAALVGGSLAVCGGAFQALLRNALATPFTLGVSAGGALGAVVAIKVGFTGALWGLGGVPAAAFAGSALTIAAVWGLARRDGALPPNTLLLSGITVNLFLSSIILFIHYLADFAESYQMVRWLMGGLDIVDIRVVTRVFPFVALGVGALLWRARDYNVLSLGEEAAASLGVDLRRLQRLTFLAASLVVGAVVSAAGPIGFVGLIVPHLVRLLSGPDHRVVLPASFLLGGAFLVACDTLARTLIAPAEVPVGVITAMFGGPFFLWLLKSRRAGVEP